jgi:hypothetical protein
MWPSDDAGLPAPGSARRPQRSGAIPPIVWSYLIAGGLLFGGLVLTAVLTAVSLSLSKVGLLIMGLSILALTVIPGGLHLLGHPLADVGYRRPLREWVRHPRLAGLAWMWLGIVMYAWMTAWLVLFWSASPLPTLWVAIPVGVGPVCAIMLFDRGR